MIKCLFTLGLSLTVLNGVALAGNYDIQRYIDDSWQAWEQQRYQQEQACRLDEINQRLQDLQDSIDNQRLRDLESSNGNPNWQELERLIDRR